jgi:excisionase family DNA binding protein
MRTHRDTQIVASAAIPSAQAGPMDPMAQQNLVLRPRLTDPLLRPEQAAQLLSVKTSWIYDAVRTGSLPCLRVGRHIRFTQAMLENWLAEQ